MAIHLAEQFGGRTRVRWRSAIAFFVAIFTACALIPAAGFWLAFGDQKLVSTALTTGFAVACLSFGAIIGTSFRTPAPTGRE